MRYFRSFWSKKFLLSKVENAVQLYSIRKNWEFVDEGLLNLSLVYIIFLLDKKYSRGMNDFHSSVPFCLQTANTLKSFRSYTSRQINIIYKYDEKRKVQIYLLTRMDRNSGLHSINQLQVYIHKNVKFRNAYNYTNKSQFLIGKWTLNWNVKLLIARKATIPTLNQDSDPCVKIKVGCQVSGLLWQPLWTTGRYTLWSIYIGK